MELVTELLPVGGGSALLAAALLCNTCNVPTYSFSPLPDGCSCSKVGVSFIHCSHNFKYSTREISHVRPKRKRYEATLAVCAFLCHILCVCARACITLAVRGVKRGLFCGILCAALFLPDRVVLLPHIQRGVRNDVTPAGFHEF